MSIQRFQNTTYMNGLHHNKGSFDGHKNWTASFTNILKIIRKEIFICNDIIQNLINTRNWCYALKLLHFLENCLYFHSSLTKMINQYLKLPHWRKWWIYKHLYLHLQSWRVAYLIIVGVYCEKSTAVDSWGTIMVTGR